MARWPPTPSRHLLIPFAGRCSPACQPRSPGCGCPTWTPCSPAWRWPTTTRRPRPRCRRRTSARWPARWASTAHDGLMPWAAREARRPACPRPRRRALGLLTLCHWEVGDRRGGAGGPAGIADRRGRIAGAAGGGAAVVRGGRHRAVRHAACRGAGWRAASCSAGCRPPRSTAPPASRSPSGRRLTARRMLRRLQNEMQMLLYTQRVNDERTPRGAPPINSLLAQRHRRPASRRRPAPAPPSVDRGCAAPALRDDAAAWAAAWQALDAGPIAALLAAPGARRAVALTLCGDRAARRFGAAAARAGRLAQGLFGRQRAAGVLRGAV